MKKSIALLSTCLVLAGVLSACSSANTSSPAPAASSSNTQASASSSQDASSSTPASSSSSQDASTSTQSSSSSAQTASSSQPTEIKLDMNEFAYSMKDVKVHAGEKIHFVLSNSGKVEHDINSEELNLDKDVAPGKTETLDWTAPTKTGTYPIICDKPGHKEQGMTFNLVVE